MRAAKNSAIDYIRKSKDIPHEEEILESLTEATPGDEGTFEDELRDDQLKLRDFPTLDHVVHFVLERAPQTAPSPPSTTADTTATWNGFAIRNAGSGRCPVRKRSG